MSSRLNVFLAFVLVLVLALLVLIRIDYSRPNYQVILGDDMTYSPAFTSFEANVNFPNGRTAQHPVPGGPCAAGVRDVAASPPLHDRPQLPPRDRAIRRRGVRCARAGGALKAYVRSARVL